MVFFKDFACKFQLATFKTAIFQKTFFQNTSCAFCLYYIKNVKFPWRNSFFFFFFFFFYFLKKYFFLKKNKKLSLSVFPDAVLVLNYHSYKEKTIKSLPYYSFYGGQIPSTKIEPPFLAVHLKKNKKPPGSPFSRISLNNFKLHLSRSLQHSTLNICGCYFFFVEYKLVTCY